MGWWFRVRGGGDEMYFLAGRKMGWFPIGLSVMVTVFSAINYVALPNEVFGFGLSVAIVLPVFLLVAWPISRYWIPFFHRMQLTSAYEYLERRFDVRVRMLASGMFMLWRVFWMATALYASGGIMGRLTGLPVPIIILAGGLVATLYTFSGGMRVVMWTDVVQFGVLFGGIVLGLVFACRGTGFMGVLELAREGGRLKPFLPFELSFFSLNPGVRITFWSGLIGGAVAFMSRYGADQVVMQRYFTARSLKMAQRGLWFNAVAAVISLSLLIMLGLAVYAHAVRSGAVSAASWDVLTPVQRKGMAMGQLAAMIRSFPAGITGLIAAGLLAATMSSIDSGINACSAAYVTDFHSRIFGMQKGPGHSIRLDRALTLGLGVSATLAALALIPLVGRTNSLFMIVNKMINGLGSPLLALFLLGMFSRRVNGPGMLAGGLREWWGVCCFLCLWMG